MKARHAVVGVALLGASWAGICDPGDITIVPEIDETYSFEGGLQGWTPAALGSISPAVNWSVDVDGGAAVEGQASLKIFLSDSTGTGRVWIERAFTVAAEEEYQVDLAYQVGTEDSTGVAPWSAIVQVSSQPPSTSGAVTVDGTLDASGGPGLRWFPRETTVNFDTGVEQETAWVSIGIASGDPGARTYRLDGLRVTFTRR
ncbi:MAG: hypothetical protein R3E10_01960 [Gemmatimonadota bacterium]